jgi:hypothetical protein
MCKVIFTDDSSLNVIEEWSDVVNVQVEFLRKVEIFRHSDGDSKAQDPISLVASLQKQNEKNHVQSVS